MPIVTKIFIYALVPVLTLNIGGVVALFKRPAGTLRSLILHFAAGVIFSVVAVELIPDVIRDHNATMTVFGFSLGFLMMMGIRKLTEAAEEAAASQDRKGFPWSIVLGMIVDVLIDGLLLGIGFAAGNAEGILLAVALSVELLSLGMATATETMDKAVGRFGSFMLIVSLSALFMISALLGGTLLHNISHNSMEIVLSFGLSALLFLVTEELLTKAHEERETVWHTSVFFVGFLIFLIFGMMIQN